LRKEDRKIQRDCAAWGALASALMEHGFWADRWQSGQIGFHQGRPNDLLLAHHQAVLAGCHSLYLPLCGKAVDLMWLAQQGHAVIGCEFVPAAVDQLFAEHHLSPRTDAVGPFVRHRAAVPPGDVTVLVGDAFALTPASLGEGGLVEGIYDRAALIAVDPKTRARYVQTLATALRPGGRMLLITLTYDQARLDGPPWSVPQGTVEELFAADFTIEHLQTRPEVAGPKFQERGITAVTESAFALTRR
jgi:thiopurine S-methyltransferase